MRDKILDLLLTIHYKSKSRSLDPSYRKDLSVRTIFKRVQTGSVHSKEPISDRPAQSGSIKRFKIFLITQIIKAFTHSVICQRAHPQALHRFFTARFLHDPPLDQFTFLAGITAIYHLVAIDYKIAYRIKLLFNTAVILQFDTEFLRNHREI